jgi:hypothetical protein
MKRIPLLLVLLLSLGFMLGCDDKEKYSTDADSFSADAGGGTNHYGAGVSAMGTASSIGSYGADNSTSFKPSNFGTQTKKAPVKDDGDDFFDGLFGWL